MKNIKRKQWLLILFTLLVVVAVSAWYLSKDSITVNNTVSNNAIEKDEVLIPPSTKSTNEKIIFVSIKDNVKEIIQSDESGKNKKTIFTDKDEERKINKFGGLAYLSQEVLAVTGEGPVGKLEMIKLDGSGNKSVIIESFSSSSPLSISPDGKTIAYVSFSNAEKDYGYSLNTINREGSNRRSIVKSEKEITSISINKDSSKIAYISTDKDGKSEIFVANIDSGKSNLIYSSSHSIFSLNWNQNDRITFTVAVDKLKTGEIWAIDSNGSNDEKIYSKNDEFPIYSFISLDFLNMTYLIEKYTDGYNATQEGNIFSADLKNNSLSSEKNNIGNANLILGWLP